MRATFYKMHKVFPVYKVRVPRSILIICLHLGGRHLLLLVFNREDKFKKMEEDKQQLQLQGRVHLTQTHRTTNSIRSSRWVNKISAVLTN